jgi:hypothetical protein
VDRWVEVHNAYTDLSGGRTSCALRVSDLLQLLAGASRVAAVSAVQLYRAGPQVFQAELTSGLRRPRAARRGTARVITRQAGGLAADARAPVPARQPPRARLGRIVCIWPDRHNLM